MLLEEWWSGRFRGISLQSRPKLFQMARTSFLEFTKKLFPATQNSAFGNPLRFVIFSFLLTISRPPRGYVRTKKSPSHFQPRTPIGAGSGIRTHEGVTPNGCHVNRRISSGDLEAVALTTQPSRRNSQQRPGRVLNHFQHLTESLDQREPEGRVFWTKGSRPSRLGSSR